MKFPRTYKITPKRLRASIEADWDGCIRSYDQLKDIFRLQLISDIWKSKFQTVVELLLVETEYVAFSSCAKDVTWLRRLFVEMYNRKPSTGEIIIPAITIEINSFAEMSIALNKYSKKLMKHISLHFNHGRHLFQHQTFLLNNISTDFKVIDHLTEPVSHRSLQKKISAYI